MDEIISIVVGFIATILITGVLIKFGCNKQAAMVGGEIVGKSAQEMFDAFQSTESTPYTPPPITQAPPPPNNSYNTNTLSQPAYNTTASRGSAVYYCNQTDALGWGYGTDYKNLAYDNCYNGGGRNCQPLISGNHYGYAAVALGTHYNGRRAVGVGAGFLTQEDAANRALNECINSGGGNAYVESIWYVDGATNYKVR